MAPLDCRLLCKRLLELRRCGNPYLSKGEASSGCRGARGPHVLPPTTYRRVDRVAFSPRLVLLMVDYKFMHAFGNFLINAVNLIADVVIVSVTAPYLAVVVVAVFLCGFGDRALYIPSSHQLRRRQIAT